MTKTLNKLGGLGVAVFFCCAGFSGELQAEVNCQAGQVCTQTIQLTPGWNAVHVQVKPGDGSIEQVFADLIDGDGPQITSVWTWLAHRAKIDFIQDPDPENLLSSPGWLRYFPAGSGESFLSNLFVVQANRSYLVKVGGGSSVTLTIAGKPVVPRASWEPDSFNLIGFHVDPSNRPTFADFFAASPAHQGQPIYLLANNVWQEVDPDTAVIAPDVAYWVYAKGGSKYVGPAQVSLPQLSRLEYGTILKQQTTRITNPLAVPQTVSLQVIGGAPGVHYPNPAPEEGSPRWLPLQNLTETISSGGEIRIPLGIRRADFAPGELLQTLQITSAAGSRWLIPVTASAGASSSASRSGSAADIGLWIGTVTIDRVSEVQNYKHDCDTDPNGGFAAPGTGFFDLCLDADGFPIADAGDVLTPVDAEFSFRVIMHQDGSQVRLLKDVLQVRERSVDGVLGEYVLLTDDTLIPQYDGVTLRDGEVVGRRLSTMAYDFDGTSQDMAGSLDVSLNIELVLAASATTNPFRHQYHADHGDGGYEVTRSMDFVFDQGDPTDPADPGLGADYDFKQGTYRETVSGLHKLPILAAGRFTLRRAAQIDSLNNQ